MNQAYVTKEYGDGDKEIYMPYWRQVLKTEQTNLKGLDLDRSIEETKFISEDEIALKHPQTGTTFKLRDDGSIELFVNEDTGIRLDPKENAIVFYGDAMHFATKEMRIHTKPQGFIWNNHNLNPYLYYGDKLPGRRIIPQLKLETHYGATSIPMFQEQARKTYQDSKVNELLNELGIDTATRKRGK